jgi:hypothetical protein
LVSSISIILEVGNNIEKKAIKDLSFWQTGILTCCSATSWTISVRDPGKISSLVSFRVSPVI